MPRYLLEVENGRVFDLPDRPTQVEIAKRGEGTYFLRKEDGSLSRKQFVRTNKMGNLVVVSETATGLEGVSTLNLTRMIKAYTVIVKNWPAKAADVAKIEAEMARREAVIRAALPMKRKAS